MLQKVAFTMYSVTDAERSRAFYEQTMNLTRGSHSKDGSWTEYDLPGGGCFALWQDKAAKTGGGSIAFEVDDLDAENARLEAAGVEFEAKMIHSPVCRMSVILDPDGNSIILHELEKK